MGPRVLSWHVRSGGSIAGLLETDPGMWDWAEVVWASGAVIVACETGQWWYVALGAQFRQVVSDPACGPVPSSSPSL